VRAVLDPNVIISALLSPNGSPAAILRSWIDGTFDLVTSPSLLDELERALGYPKIRSRLRGEDSTAILELIRRDSEIIADPTEPPDIRSGDPGDDYLIALAATSRSIIVSGDHHLLDLADQIPVISPAVFLRRYLDNSEDRLESGGHTNERPSD
jgi:putative PIN family toxin of toxin-antitoxin system